MTRRPPCFSTLLVTIACLAPTAALAEPRAPDRYSLKVHLHAQEQDSWCWAATGQMVMEYFGKWVPQVQQASRQFNRNDCGRSPTACDQGGVVMLADYGFSFDPFTQPLSRDEIVHQIYDLRKPIVFGWQYTGGGGHAMVAVGYQRLKDGTFMVEYLDPWPVPRTDPNAPAGGTHTFCTYEVWCATDEHKIDGGCYNIDPPGGPTGNLVVNGSFEEGTPAGEYLPLDKDSTAIKGWTVTRGQVDYVGTLWKAAHGGRCIDLHGSPGFGGIKQTFKTKPGQHYRVTFALAANPESHTARKRMAASAAGVTREFTVESKGATGDRMGWESEGFEFDATDAETTLELYTLETTDENCGPVIDNVRVVATIPRPMR